MTPGLHLLHKPPGVTSFSLLQSFRAGAAVSQHTPRVCHGGALDPFAEGLLLVLVEPATRLFDYIHAAPKVYEATIRWGIETDTGDPLGRPTLTGDPTCLTTAVCEGALQSFVGWQNQIPPPTSNKRIDGERAYVKAHRGEIFTLPPSRVYLHQATFLSHNLPHESRLRITVRGGYYVRSLVRDLGRLLHCGAHLITLQRTSIGCWQDPSPRDTISGAAASPAIVGRDLLPWLPTRILSDDEIGHLRQNRSIPVGDGIPPDWRFPIGFPAPENVIRGFHQNRFRFLLTLEDKHLRAVVSLQRGL